MFYCRGEPCVRPCPARFKTFMFISRLGEHKVRPYTGGIKSCRRDVMLIAKDIREILNPDGVTLVSRNKFKYRNTKQILNSNA